MANAKHACMEILMAIFKQDRELFSLDAYPDEEPFIQAIPEIRILETEHPSEWNLLKRILQEVFWPIRKQLVILRSKEYYDNFPQLHHRPIVFKEPTLDATCHMWMEARCGKFITTFLDGEINTKLEWGPWIRLSEEDLSGSSWLKRLRGDE